MKITKQSQLLFCSDGRDCNLHGQGSLRRVPEVLRRRQAEDQKPHLGAIFIIILHA
jgi:hypothetical protein